MEHEDQRNVWGRGTTSVWAGETGPAPESSVDEDDARRDRASGGADGSPPARAAGRPAVQPIVRSVTFEYDDLETWASVGRGERPGHIYSRNTNPTVELFAEKVRRLEGGAAATSFATGMAAISDTLHALLEPGDRVVSVKDSYGGTNRLFVEFLPRLGIDVELVETTDHEELERQVAAGCRVLYLESPTNPALKIVDLRRLAEAAHEVGATVVVDNTFATPINQRPLELGADLVLHSATKFLGGHSDAMGGVVCGPAETVRRIFHYREIHGASLDPEAAYLLLRGMKTLELRVERQNENALRIARFLDDHPRVNRVHYPGLPSHPGHEVARRQMPGGFGGVLAFELKGGEKAVHRALPRLRLAHRAASLGSVATLVGPPAVTSHVELTAAERAEAGIPEGLVRYSVGIENAEDLVDDLERALATLAPSGAGART
ncbi:MAG: cystathionine gamma-synthase family protein [Gemmatimonadota bacterium]